MAHIQGIIEDSPVSKSSLPTEEYAGYTYVLCSVIPLQD